MKAQKKPKYTWTAADLGADTACTGMKGSPSATKRVVEPPKREGKAVYFGGEAADAAKALADALEADHLI